MHSRYYPGEWSNSHCSKFLQNSKSKRNAFDTICKFHSPCFRFFFIEAFGHSLQEWYNARLRYSRSVATSSIVGHILGIGDRHGCNILVHGKTGEVVHIDFGIAYEVSSMLMFNPCSMLVSKFSNGFFFNSPSYWIVARKGTLDHTQSPAVFLHQRTRIFTLTILTFLFPPTASQYPRGCPFSTNSEYCRWTWAYWYRWCIHGCIRDHVGRS